MRKFAAVLLAGGRSSRMRINKALIEYHGVPLWRYQIDKLTQLGPNQLFFSVQSGVQLPPGPWTFIHDRAAGLGPLAGLEAALQQTRSDFLVALGVDMPAMTTNFLAELLEQSRSAGMVPLVDGFYCGVAAVYPVRILPLVEKILSSQDRSFQHLISEALKSETMKAKEIPVWQAPLFTNWNFPRDTGHCSQAIPKKAASG
jgi:molybdopterin-guanine dinucleotide biosynthesis protein A